MTPPEIAAAPDPDARLHAFGELVGDAAALLAAPLGIVCLAARLTARAPANMPFACQHPDKMMASVCEAADLAIFEDPRVAANIASIDALAGRVISRDAQSIGSVEGIWLFAAFAVDVVRDAPAAVRPKLVALYEAARAGRTL